MPLTILKKIVMTVGTLFLLSCTSFSAKRPKVPMLILDGLESSNSNARSRGILIHPSVVQFKTYPVPIPYLTYGCFGVSETGFNRIKGCVDSQKRKILLDAFCSE